MIKYLLGLLKNILNPAVSILAQIDNLSEIDKTAKVYGFSKVFRSKIGRYSYLGRHSRLICVEVGNFCSISSDVTVGMGTHTLNFLSTSPIFTEKNNGTTHSWIKKDIVASPFKKVTIGNDVWIGNRVLILGGLNIGDGAIIGADALVTKDVPPFAIVGGVPAKVIRYRFNDEQVEKLKNIKWWYWSDIRLKSNIALFQEKFSDEVLSLINNEK